MTASNVAENCIIRILDVQTSNQIAAGEVVERPVSVVKELVENAIDAKAKRITVKIFLDDTNNFIGKIQIIDDGYGMIAEDMLTAFYRHATSKLQSIEDLNTIYSLGFRGEALPSIASISEVEISSRTAGEIAGKTVVVTNGIPVLAGEIGMPQGTKITVQNLFYNTPARKKFLKTASAEMGFITTLISQLILSAPNIAFVFQIDGRTVLHSAGNNNLRQAVIAIYGAETAAALSQIDYTSSNQQIKIKGFVSVPPFSRSNKKYYHFFVNGRLVKSKELANILETAYETLLPERKYPMAVLYLEVPASTIDVNVHPAKTEISFNQLHELKDNLLAAIKMGLYPKEGILPKLSLETNPQDFWGEQTIYNPDKVQQEANFNNIENTPEFLQDLTPSLTSKSQNNSDNPIFDFSEMVDDLNLGHVINEHPKNAPGANKPLFDFNFGGGKTEAETSNYAASLFNRLLDKNLAEPNGLNQKKSTEIIDVYAKKPVQQEILPKTESENIFSRLKPLGQVNASFVVAVAGENLYIVDQHAAHERILYEEFAKKYDSMENQVAMLAVPVNIDLGNLQKELLLQNIDKVADFGFIVEYFGDSSFIIRGVPVWYGAGQEDSRKNKAAIFSDSIGDFFITILDRIIENSQCQSPKVEQKLNFSAIKKEELFTMACKNAVKANQYLNQTDLIWLFQKLAQAEKPLTCPHGRPVIIEISDSELRNRFMRS